MASHGSLSDMRNGGGERELRSVCRRLLAGKVVAGANRRAWLVFVSMGCELLVPVMAMCRPIGVKLASVRDGH